MELIIKNNKAIIVTILSAKLMWAVIIFLVSAFVFALLTPNNPSILDLNLIWIKSIIFPALFLAWYGIDASFYAKKTKVVLKDNSINVITGNLLRNGNYVFNFSQISGINVSQAFTQKVFSICQINISQKNNVITSVWGFSMKESELFLEKFSKEFRDFKA